MIGKCYCQLAIARSPKGEGPGCSVHPLPRYEASALLPVGRPGGMSSCVVHGSTSCGWDKGKLPTDDDSGHGTDRQQDAAADGTTPDGLMRTVAHPVAGRRANEPGAPGVASSLRTGTCRSRCLWGGRMDTACAMTAHGSCASMSGITPAGRSLRDQYRGASSCATATIGCCPGPYCCGGSRCRHCGGQ